MTSTRRTRLRRQSPDVYLELALSRFLRPFLRKSVSRDRISQSFFVQLARNSRHSEVHYFSSGTSSLSLEQYQREVHSGSIVLVGSSDRDFFEEDLRELRKDINFYVQNLCAPTTNNIHTLPIGVEDLAWARAGMPWNFTSIHKRRNKSKFLLVGPFGATHPDRGHLEVLKGAGNVDIVQRRMSSIRYASMASKYMFVACPRGNGRDTHRIWESLYRGSVPVMLEDDFGRNLKNMGLPIVLVSDWRQAPEACLENLALSSFTPSSIPQLLPSFWRKLLGC